MKLSHFVACLFVAATMGMMITDAAAQGGGGQGGRGQGRDGAPGRAGGGMMGGGMMGGGMMGGRMMDGDSPMVGLLMIDKVREELALEEDQLPALQKIRSDNRPERSDFDFSTASAEERRAAMEKAQAQRSERVKKMREQLEEILLPKQLERLEEISLQVRGAAALADPEIQTKLAMTDKEKAKLEEVRTQVQEKMRLQMREMMQNRGDRDAMRDAFTKARKDVDEEVMKALTDKQRAKFNEMKGKPFEMPENAGGFGQGGGVRDGRGEGGRGGEGDRGNRPRRQAAGSTE